MLAPPRYPSLYARARIVEYWGVDAGGTVLSFIAIHGLGESIEPLSAPGRKFLVEDAFPA
jgi:hypothetical protein